MNMPAVKQGEALAVAGHNNPPTPFDEIREEIDGLYLEAKNWLDGSGVNTEADANGVSKLLDMLRQAEKKADKMRVDEKKPHDDAGKAVQAKFKPLLDCASRAIDVCKGALTPYLRKQEEARQEAAKIAREEAEAAERAAQAAFAASGPSDLEMREEAERLAEAAKGAAAAANRIEKERAQAKGGARAVSLRTTYRAEITDQQAFARWAWINCRADLDEFLETLAKRFAKSGVNAPPGITIHEDQGAV